MTDMQGEINKQARKEMAAIEALKTTVVYPRFLGIDDSGDFVWELADGRWTFGDDPHHAAVKQRTLEPKRYVEKYGVPTPISKEV